MNRRRAEILAEMGLEPVWRLRQPVLPPPVPPPSAELRERSILGLEWQPLKQRVEGCTDCRLRASCRQTVFGVGDERAGWMLVGEAPGADEDRLGEPFVGQAGKLLDNMLAAIGLARGTDVYIANVLKCRPPGNRNPQPDEVAQCSPYLLRQIGDIGRGHRFNAPSDLILLLKDMPRDDAEAIADYLSRLDLEEGAPASESPHQPGD